MQKKQAWSEDLKMRVLVSEIGNKHTGDESICLGAARRLLSMGAKVSFCYRVSLEEALKKAGLTVNQVYMPVEEKFEGISTTTELIKAFAKKEPQLYNKMQQVIKNHDLLAVAPGGKFAEGYKNARTILAAAVALHLGQPVIVLHQSVGPINNPDHLKLLTEVFRSCTMLLVRDDQSYNFLLELGIPSNKLVRCRDVAMGEEYPAPTRIDYDLGINIRCGPNGHVNIDALSQFISDYKSYCPEDRILVYSTTYNLHSKVVERLTGLPCDLQIKVPAYPDYLKEIGRCAVNIADSFHGCIFSMMADRPAVCCQTDYKTWKLKGLPAPEQEPLEVLPGLVSKQEAEKLLHKVVAVRNNPEPHLRYQRRIVGYGREMCEEGWAAVENTLESI